MKYYISIDGGGSKLALLLFDENLQPLSYSVSAGVNPHLYTAVQISEHCIECFSRLLAHCPSRRIEGVYGADLNLLNHTLEIVSGLAEFSDYVQLNEGLVGLLSNGLYPDGIVALSGTGSDVFYLRNGRLEKVSGGLGALLGDDGSGFMIGREGVRAALMVMEGLGDPTVLKDSLIEFIDMEPEYRTDISEYIRKIYDGPYPVARIASFSRYVGRAARMGDSVSLGILDKAGAVMAEQVLNMIRRLAIPPEIPICTIGGAYKAHPAMLEAFKRAICEGGTRHIVYPNLFEPVVGGVLYKRVLDNGCLTPEDIETVKELYNEFLYK